MRNYIITFNPTLTVSKGGWAVENQHFDPLMNVAFRTGIAEGTFRAPDPIDRTSLAAALNFVCASEISLLPFH